jgi:hypothetical protein
VPKINNNDRTFSFTFVLTNTIIIEEHLLIVTPIRVMSRSNAKGPSLVQRSGPKITKGENEISQTKKKVLNK